MSNIEHDEAKASGYPDQLHDVVEEVHDIAMKLRRLANRMEPGQATHAIYKQVRALEAIGKES